MRNQTTYGEGAFCVVKAVLLSLAVSLLAAVTFAVVHCSASWGEGIVYTVDQILKSVSLLIGVFAFVRGEKGWLKGGVAGLLFTALSYLAFSAIGGDFSLSWLIFLELLLAFFTGAIGGILAVNWKR